MPDQSLAVLCPARKDSPCLAHFVLAMQETIEHAAAHLYLLLNSDDTWNKGLRRHCAASGVRVLMESDNRGRFALDDYYTALAKDAMQQRPDWYLLACDDFDPLFRGWDIYCLEMAARFGLTPEKPCLFVPRTDNGHVCHMLSRGYVEAVDGVIARHYSVDTFVNQVFEKGPYKVSPEVVFRDYTRGGTPWQNYKAPPSTRPPFASDGLAQSEVARYRAIVEKG